MVETFGLGGTAILRGRFRDHDTGALADPSDVFLDVTAPDGTPTTYQYGVGSVISKLSTGEYKAEIPASAVGYWRYRWRSTGTANAGALTEKYRVAA